MTAATDPTYTLTQVDGVTTVVTTSGRTGLSAELTFRHGLVDEPLGWHGLTHLIEHIALHGRERGSLSVNGSVGLLLTRFVFSGETEDVARALESLAGWLAAPAFGDLAHETAVLTAESRTHGTNLASLLLQARYGTGGPALGMYNEFGLRRATPERLRDVTAYAFTAGNAVLWLDGEVPGTLRLPLPPGPWRPAPDPAVLPDVDHTVFAVNGVAGLTALLTRSTTADVYGLLLSDRVDAAFRHADASSYGAQVTQYSVSARQQAVVLEMPVADSVHADAGRRLAEVLWDLAERGPEADELTHALQRIRRSCTDPRAATGLVRGSVPELLLGGSVQDADAAVADLDLIDAARIRAAAREAWATVILALPEPVVVPQGFRRSDEPVHVPARDGRRFRDSDDFRHELVLTPEALQTRTGDLRQEFTFAEVAGMVCFPDGARVLVHRTGTSFRVEPGRYTGGAGLVAELDRIVAPELHIPGDDRPAEQQIRVPWWQRIVAAGPAWFHNQRLWVRIVLLTLFVGVATALTAAFDQVWFFLVALLILPFFLVQPRGQRRAAGGRMTRR